jgi:hypothetical protein
VFNDKLVGLHLQCPSQQLGSLVLGGLVIRPEKERLVVDIVHKTVAMPVPLASVYKTYGNSAGGASALERGPLSRF